MQDAESFSYGDPASLYSADAPIQQAFQRLTPLAQRHDAVRLGGVKLWAGAPAWEDVALFSGHGVVQRRATSMSPPVWRWQPEGHPVARLVKAALEEPGDDVDSDPDAGANTDEAVPAA